MKSYRFKIGTHSVFSKLLASPPVIGEHILLPFPTGGIYSALITEFSNDVYFGEWL